MTYIIGFCQSSMLRFCHRAISSRSKVVDWWKSVAARYLAAARIGLLQRPRQRFPLINALLSRIIGFLRVILLAKKAIPGDISPLKGVKERKKPGYTRQSWSPEAVILVRPGPSYLVKTGRRLSVVSTRLPNHRRRAA